MERFSPKIELINQFDNLIQKVDVDIEENIEKYKKNDLLRVLQRLKDGNIRIDVNYKFKIEFFKFCESSDHNKEQTVDQWSESTKVVDYLNQIRMTTIEELRKEQKESVENSSHFNSLINAELTKEEKRSQLFAEKFYFQVNLTRNEKNLWVFNLFTFVTDFYISQSDIDLLQKLINDQVTNETNLSSNHILDEKMILICLLYKCFLDNLNNQRFPSHVIHVFKHDVSKIEKIDVILNISAINLNSLSFDLSKLKRISIITETALDYIIIDSLYSLEYLCLDFTSANEISIKNLYQLKDFYISSKKNINLQTDILDHLPNIEDLYYCIDWMNNRMRFKFLKLEKSIKFSENLNMNDLNLDLFMNKLNNQIEKLEIEESNIENITCILSHYHFPTLLSFSISCCDITRIEKKLFDALPPMIQTFQINYNNNLNIIDHDAFSNFKQLCYLVMGQNSIEYLDRRHFSSLINLEGLYLDHNRLKRLDGNIFEDLKNLKSLDISRNQLKSLEANSFTGLQNLKVLDLSRNEFKTIDYDLFSNLEQLECLDLTYNSIELLDIRLFSSLINLERLYLSHNGLKRLDEYTFSDLKNLKRLDLSENQLETLDANTFVGLENLNQLNLNKNQLEIIHHEAFSYLKRLDHLDICQNNVESLDRRHFSSLINLESLYLSNNRLKILGDNIFSDLKNVEILDLSENQLETLDANTFFGLENLNQLFLNYNKLHIIHHEAFTYLKRLIFLNLHYNYIDSLDRRLFSGLVNLEELYLRENRLKRLDENIFSNLKNLKELRFSNNQLEILHTNSFVGLDNLHALNLNLNKLKHFDVRIFDNLPRLNYINLSGNEISNINEIKETLSLCKRKTICDF